MCKLSITYNVLESYKVVDLQVQYLNNIWKDNWCAEVVIIDDGSSPPITFKTEPKFPCNIFYTNDFRPWTQATAKNFGAEHSNGEYIFFLAIDHFPTPESIEFCLNFSGSKVVFPRKFAYLLEGGEVGDDPKVMVEKFALQPIHLEEPRNGFTGGGFDIQCLKAKHFWEVGGYGLHYAGKYGSEDIDFHKRYAHLVRVEKKAEGHVVGPWIYVYPNPCYDAQKLFHSLRRQGWRHPIPKYKGE